MEQSKELKLMLEDLKNVLSNQMSNPLYVEVSGLLKSYFNEESINPTQVVESLSKYKHDYFINETIKEISSKFNIEEAKTSHVSQDVTNSIYEFQIIEDLRKVRTTQAGKHPMVSSYILQLEQYVNNNKGVPHYRFINDFVTKMTPYKYDSEIKAVVEKLETYVKENQSKLLFLDSVYNLRKQNVNGFYNQVLEKLENCIYKNDYSYSSLQLETRSFKDMPVVKTLVNELAKTEGKTFKVWETNTNSIKVNNVVCPIKSEKDKVVLFLEGKFLMVSNNKITQLTESKVESKLPKFYSYAKVFESIGFTNNQNGVSKTISNYINLDIKLNENNELKPFINNVEITNNTNVSEVAVTESNDVRSKLVSLFSEINKVSLLEDVKLIENKSTGDKIYVFKLEEKYNVFAIEGNRIKLFESNGYNTYKYVLNKFKFDLSQVFENEIQTAHNTLKKIESKKQEIISSLAIVESSIGKVDESIRLNAKDEVKLNKLTVIKEELEKEVITLKNAYTTLDIESKEISSIKEEATNYTYEMGEKVKLKDGSTGEVVSINDFSNEYGIYTDDNKFIVAKEEDIESSISVDGSIEGEVKQQGDDVPAGEENIDKSVQNVDLELDTIEGEEEEKPEEETEETIDDLEENPEETLMENVMDQVITPSTLTVDAPMMDDQSMPASTNAIYAEIVEDYGDFKAGQKVQIDPTSYTSAGDEDLVAIITVVSPEEGEQLSTVVDQPSIELSSDDTIEPEGMEINGETNDASNELETSNNDTNSITIPKKFLKVENPM